MMKLVNKKSFATVVTSCALALVGIVSAPAAHATDVDPSIISYSGIVDPDVNNPWYSPAGAYAWTDGTTNLIAVDFVNPLDIPFQSDAGYIPLIHAAVPGCDQFNLYEPNTTIFFQTLPRNGVDAALMHVIFSTDSWNCDLSNASSITLTGTFTHRYINTYSLGMPSGVSIDSTVVNADSVDFYMSGLPSLHGDVIPAFISIDDNQGHSVDRTGMTYQSSAQPNGQTKLSVRFPALPTGQIWQTGALNIYGSISYVSAVSPTAIADAFAGTPLTFGTQTTTYDSTAGTLTVSVDATNSDPVNGYYAEMTPVFDDFLRLVSRTIPSAGGVFSPGQTKTLTFVLSGSGIINSDLTPLAVNTATHVIALSVVDGAGISGYWNCCTIVSNVTAREVADIGGGSHLDVFADVENAGNQVNKLHWGTPETNGTAMTNIGPDLLVAPNQKIVGTRVGSISQTQSWLGQLLTINSPSDGYANSNLYRVDLLAPHDSDFYNDRTAHCISNTQTDQWGYQSSSDGTYHEGDGSTLVQVTSNQSQSCGIFAMRHFNVLVDGTNDGVTLLGNQERTAIYTTDAVYNQNGWHAIAKVAPERAVSETGGLQATVSYSTEYSPMLDFTAAEHALENAGFFHANANIVSTPNGIKVTMQLASMSTSAAAFRLGSVKIGDTTLTPPTGSDITTSLPASTGSYTNVVLGTISYDNMFALQSGAVTLTMSDNRNSYDFTDTNAALHAAGLPIIQSIQEDNSDQGTLTMRATFCSENNQEGDFTITQRTVDSGLSQFQDPNAQLFSLRAANGYCTASPIWFMSLTGNYADVTFVLGVNMFSDPLSSIAVDVPSSDGFTIGASDIQLSERGDYTATLNYNNSSGGVFYAHVDLNLYDENNVLVDQIIDGRRQFESGNGTFWTFAISDQMLHGHNLTLRGTITQYEPSTVTNSVQLSPVVNLYLSDHAIYDREMNSQTGIQYSLLNASEDSLLALIDLKVYDANNNVVASYTGSRIINRGNSVELDSLKIPGDVGDGQSFDVRGDITTIYVPNCDTQQNACPWSFEGATFSGLGTSTPQITIHAYFGNPTSALIGYNSSFVFALTNTGDVAATADWAFTVEPNSYRLKSWTVNLTSPVAHQAIQITGLVESADIFTPTQGLTMPAGVSLKQPITQADVVYNFDRDTSTLTLHLKVPFGTAPNTYRLALPQVNGTAQGTPANSSTTCTDTPVTTVAGKTCTVTLVINDIQGDIRLYPFAYLTGALTLLTGKTPTPAVTNCACVTGTTMTIATKGAGVVYSAKKKSTTVAATFMGVKNHKYKVKAGSIKLTYYVTEKVRGKLRKVKKTATITLKAQTIKATGRNQSIIVFTLKNLNLKTKATNIVVTGKFTVTAG